LQNGFAHRLNCIRTEKSSAPRLDSKGVAKKIPGHLGPYRLLNVVIPVMPGELWQAYDDGKQRMVAVKALLEKAAKDKEQIGYLRQEYKVGLQGDPRANRRGLRPRYPSRDPLLGDGVVSRPRTSRSRSDPKKTGKKSHTSYQKIIEQSAEGLACLHGHGWVPADVKPDNFLRRRGRKRETDRLRLGQAGSDRGLRTAAELQRQAAGDPKLYVARADPLWAVGPAGRCLQSGLHGA